MEKIFACDFETAVDPDETFVWLAGCSELFTNQIFKFQTIDSMFEFFWKKNRKYNIVAFFHNLKFDGMFWLDFLMNHKKLKLAGINGKNGWVYYSDKAMSSSTFKFLVNSKGEWFGIKIKKPDGKYIMIQDSLKILPISIEKIADKFGIPEKKGSIDYEKKREKMYVPDQEELDYIENDVVILRKALEEMYKNQGGIKGKTIGSICWKEWRNSLDPYDQKHSYFMWKDRIINLFDFNIDERIFGQTSAYAYINKSYMGGWNYINEKKMNKMQKNGITIDCNGLYSYVMHSKSKNIYPVGKPIFFQGKIPSIVLNQKNKFYYFIRIKTRFYLKKGKLPFIRIKNDFKYNTDKILETSDIFYNGKYYKKYKDFNGNIQEAIPELTLTQTDFELLQENYDLEDLEYISGCYFKAEIGLFDEYINKYQAIKENSSGANRQIAKLYLNNLAGKFAQSRNSSYKVPFKSEKFDNFLFYDVVEYGLSGGYIPIGSAITSYARKETIKTAELFGDSFDYSDTDSVHANGFDEKILEKININEKELGAWKIEKRWDEGYFFRKKGYIEKENGIWDLRCAGMSDRCKLIFLRSIGQKDEKELNLDEKEKEYIKKGNKVEDLAPGLVIPGNLKMKKIKGGAVLIKEEYKMRNL